MVEWTLFIFGFHEFIHFRLVHDESEHCSSRYRGPQRGHKTLNGNFLEKGSNNYDLITGPVTEISSF